MRLKWLLSGVVVLGMLGIALLRMFGPNSGATLSPQTTFLMAPLAEDGLPNYALALVERQREGVTAENNAARLLWQAVGQAGVTAEQFKLLCRELELEFGPQASRLTEAGGKDSQRRIAAWIAASRRQRGEDATDLGDADSDDNAAAIELIDAAYGTPWTAEQIPPLAEWLAVNEAPLDLLVAGAAKERFYSPPPNVLENPQSAVVEMLLPHVQVARTGVRGLAVRSMFRAGSGQLDEAWDDCLAIWRWGEHIAEGPFAIDKLVALAIRGMAAHCTLALLQAEGATEVFARRVLDDLDALAPSIAMAETLDQAERFTALDSTLRMATGRLGGMSDDLGGGFPGPARVLAFNVDVLLRIANSWYDRLATAAAIDDLAERRRAMAQIDSDLAALVAGAKKKVLWGLISRRKRSEGLGEVMVGLMLPALDAAVRAEDRDATMLRMTRLAAALAIHRARTGAYPESLAELAPMPLAEIPLDPYRKAPFVYERRGEGYVLYSVFENEQDDGGRDYDGKIVDGEWLPADEQSGSDFEKSDLVFRVPAPRVQWPGAMNKTE